MTAHNGCATVTTRWGFATVGRHAPRHQCETFLTLAGRTKSAGFRRSAGGNLLRMIVTALVVIGLFVVMGFFFPVMFIAALAAAFLLALSFAAGFRRTKAEMEKADPGVDTLK